MASVPEPKNVCPGNLFENEDRLTGENPEYLRRQLVTYIGNKRALGKQLGTAILKVRARLGGRRLDSVDLFAGSGYVSRLMKQHSKLLVTNDLEPYAADIARCFLANREDVDLIEARQVVDSLNARAQNDELVFGFIQELYAPQDDRSIKPGERAFYTRDNARRVDLFAQEIGALQEPLRSLLLGPLLSKASVHVNTSGVFKGFYKDKTTGLGKYGASAGDALQRILAPIELEIPYLSQFSSQVVVHTSDANELVRELPDLDLAYIDPPYNQHPYGSNYFMLNLIARYQAPDAVSQVSGIPVEWNRSGYNVRTRAFELLEDLVVRTPARFLLVSFNDEGHVDPPALRNLLEREGRVEEVVTTYNAFRGSRNLQGRKLHVNEHLYLLERR